MARVTFTANLQRHVATPPMEVAGATVREALEAVFARNSAVRGYVLDDQGRVRKHVTIFVNAVQISDRTKLTDPVPDNSEIWIMQALSGG